MINTVQPGCRVTMHYELRLTDETVVDTTRAGEPASFLIGSGEIIDLLEQRLLGLQSGDCRHFEISAKESQTAASEDAVQTLARSDFPSDMPLETGQVFGFSTPSGEEVPGVIVSVTDAEVIVDFSHPLAGRDLKFDVEILAIEPG